MMIRNILSSFRFSSQANLQHLIDTRKDAYQAIHITPKESIESSAFEKYIKTLLQENKTKQTTSVWVHLNGSSLALAHILVNYCGFSMHHAKKSNMSLYKWVKTDKSDRVPPYSLHVVSCGGIVINNNQALIVKEKSGQLKGKYGFPGGRADPNEGIQKCAQREVFQQLGLRSTFKKILWIRELGAYVYGSYDMYFGCLVSVQKEEFSRMKLCEDEIQLVEWIHLSKLREFMSTRSVGTQQKLAFYLQQLYQQGFDFNGETAFSAELYTSPIDKKQRFFGQHFLG